MARYILRRVGTMLLALFFIVSATFFMLKAIPGGPFASEKKLPPSIEENITKKYHLDDPWYIQYRDYLIRTAEFDLGPSYRYEGRTVNDIIADGFPVSAQLGFVTVLISIVTGISLGTIAALNRNKFHDYFAMILATLGFSVPSFIVAFILMYIFAYKLRLLPPALWGTWKHLVLPAVSLSFVPTAVIARLIRSNMVEVLQQDYIKTAKAKGLKKTIVIYRHALRNAITPVVIYLGPLVTGIFTGSFVIEHIFAIPGLGRHFVMSIQNRDYTVILGITVFYSLFLMTMNLAVDIMLTVIDPRVQLVDEKR
ncbi:MAG: oligopeptide transport system permease protein [Clostridia bacterium]|nr:oligopeptide transport system permease protein [Clostridiales bacterium]MDK2986685.1 oligopeptide transport system permease protein [Clostridia bacterium]